MAERDELLQKYLLNLKRQEEECIEIMDILHDNLKQLEIDKKSEKAKLQYDLDRKQKCLEENYRQLMTKLDESVLNQEREINHLIEKVRDMSLNIQQQLQSHPLLLDSPKAITQEPITTMENISSGSNEPKHNPEEIVPQDLKALFTESKKYFTVEIGIFSSSVYNGSFHPDEISIMELNPMLMIFESESDALKGWSANRENVTVVKGNEIGSKRPNNSTDMPETSNKRQK